MFIMAYIGTKMWAAFLPLLLLPLLPLLPAQAQAQTRFRFPAEDSTGQLFMEVPIVHVDHDPKISPTKTQCQAYNGKGLPWCYDQHDGTDYLLRFGFGTMDKYNVKVVAAADGVVTYAVDGNYDRCKAAKNFNVSCDGYPMKANAVKVRHSDGILSH